MKQLQNRPPVTWIMQHKRLLGGGIVIGSFGFFGIYLYLHPHVLDDVIHIPWQILIVLALLYSVVVVTNTIITLSTVRLCKKELPQREGLLLTIYSTLVNFFGPLQSGPGVRAVYLKAKLGLRIRDYTYATILYYIAFASINISLLLATALPILALLGGVFSIALTIFGAKKLKLWQPKYIAMIYVTTLLQIIVMATIYFVELHATNTPAQFTQSLTYGASANLSMFVSLTPGAIGIREAFLAFAQSLHHISLGSIIAAGVLDRAFYVLFLLGLLGVSSGLHIKQTLFRKKTS